jgi:hypothetical protein
VSRLKTDAPTTSVVTPSSWLACCLDIVTISRTQVRFFHPLLVLDLILIFSLTRFRPVSLLAILISLSGFNSVTLHLILDVQNSKRHSSTGTPNPLIKLIIPLQPTNLTAPQDRIGEDANVEYLLLNHGVTPLPIPGLQDRRRPDAPSTRVRHPLRR